MSEKHFIKTVTSPLDTVCRGARVEVTIERLLLQLHLWSNDFQQETSATAVRVLFRSLGKCRLNTLGIEQRMIDSDGIQHAELDTFGLTNSFRVGPKPNSSFTIECLTPAREIEAQAAVRGWILFPALESNVYPRRLIFRFEIWHEHASEDDDVYETIEHVLTLDLGNESPLSLLPSPDTLPADEA